MSVKPIHIVDTSPAPLHKYTNFLSDEMPYLSFYNRIFQDLDPNITGQVNHKKMAFEYQIVMDVS